MRQIFCVCVSGSNIPPEISDFIFIAACELFKEKEKTVRIESEVCDGFITTKYTYGTIAAVSGLVFRGQVSWLDKTSSFEFICRERDLENPPKNRKWDEDVFTFTP